MNCDISLRDELVELFNIDLGKQTYAPYIVRTMRRDSSYNSIKCYCWSNAQGEGKAGCPNCDGIGYVWDEQIVPGYLFFITTTDALRNLKTNTAGRQNKYESGFITQFDIKLSESDRLYIPCLTNEGFFQIPIIMKETYLITTVKEFRLEGGRTEYVFAYLEREK